MKYIAIILSLFIVVSCGKAVEESVAPKSVTTLEMENVESEALQEKIEAINADTSLTIDEKMKQIRALVETDEVATEVEVLEEE